ncbi:hypothetical protein [Flavobacterium branchiicola]|uniref:Uncharacterized protein n=1 Tax=Flavobacterium branchiicola TaxID=1114875 RepID=A0ABV9PDQ5_9FLAO|nr:hypothetical protein [Flavobacterium branchiicola]MBS7254666.1 hypothetical protein [Flavobacterium branchiicola]
MELEKLQQKSIDTIDFVKKIDPEIEKIFMDNYKNIGIEELTKSFLLDLKTFEEILKNNKSKMFCKFYFIQKGRALNLGLSFSDNEECDIKANNLIDDDVLYILENDSITKKDFREMKIDFVNGIGAKLPTHPKNKKDTLISYSLNEINFYLEEMRLNIPDIYSLKFNMFKYSPTNKDPKLSDRFTERKNRIAFCVHAIFNKKNGLYGESEGYDLGNLKP